MFCNKCGSELPDGAKFCKKCGAPVKAAQDPSLPSKAPETLGKRTPFVKSWSQKNIAVRNKLEDYSWEELSRISQLIAGAPDDETGLKIAGNYNLVTETGAIPVDDLAGNLIPRGKSFDCLCYEYTYNEKSNTYDVRTEIGKCSARILGFRHDVRSDGTGLAGITFACTSTSYYKNVGDAVPFYVTIGPCRIPFNKEESVFGGWELSFARKFLNDDLLKGIDYDLASLIVPVQKRSNNTGVAWLGDVNDDDFVTETSDRLWLPSVVEELGQEGILSSSWFTNNLNTESGKNYADRLPFLREGDQYQAFRQFGKKPLGYMVLGALTRSVWAISPLARADYYAPVPTVVCSGEGGEMGAGTTKSVKFPLSMVPCFCI